jgi:hypothetical protein
MVRTHSGNLLKPLRDMTMQQTRKEGPLCFSKIPSGSEQVSILFLQILYLTEHRKLLLSLNT